MKLRLDRFFKGTQYTIGKLYIDNVYFCDTIEDVDRGLLDSMTKEEIQKRKIQNETAIPRGTYNITMNVISPKYSTREPYKSKCNGGRLPRLLNVKGFDGILIHIGNTHKDSSGCILVGYNKVKGQVINSTDTFLKLYDILKKAKDEITIDIE